VEGEELVSVGVGVASRGRGTALATGLAVPLEGVSPQNALGLLAACPAKVILSRLEAALLVSVTLRLLARRGGAPRLVASVEVLARGPLTRGEVEGAFWSCPLMRALQPLVELAGVEVRGGPL